MTFFLQLVNYIQETSFSVPEVGRTGGAPVHTKLHSIFLDASACASIKIGCASCPHPSNTCDKVMVNHKRQKIKFSFLNLLRKLYHSYSYRQTLASPGKLKVIHSVIT
jgi:hypothetical protein